MKSIILLFLFICFTCTAYAQALIIDPAIQWQKSLGGKGEDGAFSIIPTKDGGFIVAGNSSSNDGDVSGNHGLDDYWIVKLDSIGAVQWQKSLGGISYDFAHSIEQTKDGGYIVAGSSFSVDGDVNGNHGGNDYWIVKLDSGGNIQWQKCLGGTSTDLAYSIQQTKDGGYIVAGWSQSDNGDVIGHHGDYSTTDYWIVKLDNTGAIQWQKSLGGTSSDYANSVQQTKDGGYIVAGYSYSSDGDITGHHSNSDYWIVKLDNAGTIQWQKSLGGVNADKAYSIQQTKDGGYIVAGDSNSNDGDVNGHHGSTYFTDYWIVKLDNAGTIQWQKSLGGTQNDYGYNIQQTKDNGYIVAGYSYSNDGDVSGHHGSNSYCDYWIIKLDSIAIIKKEQSFGGTSHDFCYSIQQTKDNGFIAAGYSYSKGGDASGHHGDIQHSDYWIVKLKSPRGFADTQNNSIANTNAVVEKNTTTLLHVQPNPSYTGLFAVDMGTIKNNLYINVVDNSGRQVYVKQLGSAKQFDVQLTNKPKGIYYLHVHFDGGEKNAQLMIE